MADHEDTPRDDKQWTRIAPPVILGGLSLVLVFILFHLTRPDGVPLPGEATGVRPLAKPRSSVNAGPGPRLTQCTRLEIQYHPSAMEYLDIFARNPGLLSSAEREYLQMLDRAVIDDPRRIGLVAECLRSGSYSEITAPLPNPQKYIEVYCYHRSEQVGSFIVYELRCIVTDDGREFRPDVFPAIESLAPELNPLVVRRGCAERLARLGDLFGAGRQSVRRADYGNASQWCEPLLGVPKLRTAWERRRSLRRMARQVQPMFCCPGSRRHDRRSDYAMNPNCRPDSPADTVLLFEARPRWNQHGGPELFTFDNHDPRGGCVLLNDGSVKFIRTEEELKQLRWK